MLWDHCVVGPMYCGIIVLWDQSVVGQLCYGTGGASVPRVAPTLNCSYEVGKDMHFVIFLQVNELSK